ncbi:MAG: hypothetical protein ACAI35_19225 [Candidatus Methylacidiphilales bacterium]
MPLPISGTFKDLSTLADSDRVALSGDGIGKTGVTQEYGLSMDRLTDWATRSPTDIQNNQAVAQAFVDQIKSQYGFRAANMASRELSSQLADGRPLTAGRIRQTLAEIEGELRTNLSAAGLKGQEIDASVNAGLSPRLAVEGIKLAFTDEGLKQYGELRVLKHSVFEKDSASVFKQVEKRFTPDEIVKLIRANVSASDAEAGLQAGQSLDTIISSKHGQVEKQRMAEGGISRTEREDYGSGFDLNQCIALKRAKISPVVAKALLGAKFTVGDMLSAARSNVTLPQLAPFAGKGLQIDEIIQAVEHGLSATDAVAFKKLTLLTFAQAAEAVELKLTPEKANSYLLKGFTFEQMKELARGGVDANSADGFRKLGYSVEDAVQAVKQGVKLGVAENFAYGAGLSGPYQAAGFTPHQGLTLLHLGVPADQARSFIDKGFSFEETVAAIKGGMKPEMAEAFRGMGLSMEAGIRKLNQA